MTQSPKDVPADVLAQLGNRVQHQLRAFTPEDAKAIKAAVRTYPHTDYDLEELLTQLGTGEAVVTVLGDKGTPTPVAHTMMRAPQSLMAPSAPELLEQTTTASPLAPKYSEALDRESAYEKLSARLEAAPAAGEDEAKGEAPPAPSKAPKAPRQPKKEEGMVEKVVGSSAFKSALRSAGTVIGREITRSIFGTSRRRR